MYKKVLIALFSILILTVVASSAAVVYCYWDDFAPREEHPGMDNSKIPQYAWEALIEKLDYDEDNALRVSDAIRIKKTSDIICDIIYEGKSIHIPLIPEPLEAISERIREENEYLLAVWKDEDDAYFLFFNGNSGKPCILQNNITTSKTGFIELWDQDGDNEITEKDAARFWQDNNSSFMALAISAYAQFGADVFPVTEYKDGNAEEKLTEIIRHKDGKYNPINIAYIDSEKVCVFNYKEKTVSYVYY